MHIFALLFENPGAVALLEFCKRSEQNSSIYIKIESVCLSVCLSVCSCLFAGLTAARINLKFGMHTLIGSDCAIGYIIFTSNPFFPPKPPKNPPHSIKDSKRGN